MSINTLCFNPDLLAQLKICLDISGSPVPVNYAVRSKSTSQQGALVIPQASTATVQGINTSFKPDVSGVAVITLCGMYDGSVGGEANNILSYWLSETSTLSASFQPNYVNASILVGYVTFSITWVLPVVAGQTYSVFSNYAQSSPRINPHTVYNQVLSVLFNVEN